jgi:hypothetical protein
MLDSVKMSKRGLEKFLSASNEIIERCVTLPIIVKTSKKLIKEKIRILHKIIKQII